METLGMSLNWKTPGRLLEFYVKPGIFTAFTKRRFYFQPTRVHSTLELFGRCALQIYLLTYSLSYLLLACTNILTYLLILMLLCLKNKDFLTSLLMYLV